MTSVYTLPAEPQSIGRVLDAGTKLFTSSFKRTIGLAIAVQLVLLLPSLVLIPVDDEGAGVLESVVVLITTLLAFVVYLTLFLALTARLWKIATGADLSTSAALRIGLQKTGTVVLGAVIYALMVMGGFILLIIPCIYLSVSRGLFSYLIVTEGLKARAAIKRSGVLVSGNWWRTVAVFTVPIMLMISVVLIVQVLPLFLLGADLTTGEFNMSPVTEWFVNLVAAVINAPIVIWLLAIMLVLYQDLRLRKEGSDLEQRVESLADRT